MKSEYFVLEFAHSIHGRVKKIEIGYRSLGIFFGALVLFALSIAGLASSYVRMSWKVSHYNQLRADFDRLRTRYQDLQRISSQHREQMASLESLASEVSVAYGLNQPRPTSVTETTTADKRLTPTVNDSIQEYNFLKSASYSGIFHRYAFRWQTHTQPSIWPIAGVLRSSFGGRSDPFSGEGAFHTGIDLAAPRGTPVHVTADGVVVSTAWAGAYGKLVVVDHGNGLHTYYAHLSQFLVVPGQEVSRDQVIALSGSSGRATGPHMHYEVRLGGTPVNPYKYLVKSARQRGAEPHHSYNDLGL